jgi:hypothetical protein
MADQDGSFAKMLMGVAQKMGLMKDYNQEEDPFARVNNRDIQLAPDGSPIYPGAGSALSAMDGTEALVNHAISNAGSGDASLEELARKLAEKGRYTGAPGR